MRITFVSPAPDMSGGAKVLAIYARELAALGHDVLVVAPPYLAPAAFRERLRKLRDITKRRRPNLATSTFQSHLENANFNVRILDKARAVRDRDLPDAHVVIATWWETAEWVNSLQPSKGVKVYFIQGHETFDHMPVARVRSTYGFPMHKIVVSHWLKSIMDQLYDDPHADVVLNSVDLTQFYSPERGKQQIPTIGFIYASGSMKGLDLTLAALDQIQRHLPSVRCVCFGNQMPSEALPLLANMEFHFCPNQRRIREIYSQCDVWVTASRSEGFNLTAMEAMACRTPVVSTKTGWPLEALQNGVNGILVDHEDVDAIAKSVSTILCLDDLRWRQMSQSAYDTVSNSSWRTSALKFEQALFHACERAKNGEVTGNAL